MAAIQRERSGDGWPDISHFNHLFHYSGDGCHLVGHERCQWDNEGLTSQAVCACVPVCVHVCVFESPVQVFSSFFFYSIYLFIFSQGHICLPSPP